MNKRTCDTDCEMKRTRVCGTEALAWRPQPANPRRRADESDTPNSKRIGAIDGGACEFSLDDVRCIVLANVLAHEATIRAEYDKRLEDALSNQYQAFTQWCAEQSMHPSEPSGMNYFC